MILEGRVKVNGRVLSNPGHKLVPETAKIVIDGQRAKVQAPLTLVLHKPRGVVTTRSDEKGRPTVYSLLEGVAQHVIPVGRLDFATTGLLLLTNDTRFAAWITDPENTVPRIYTVSVRGEVSDETVARLEAGVWVDKDRLQARELTVRKRSARETHLVIELIEGKNREIRRMFVACGHEVTRLARTSFGGLELGELALGRWREVSIGELRKAFPGAPLRER